MIKQQPQPQEEEEEEEKEEEEQQQQQPPAINFNSLHLKGRISSKLRIDGTIDACTCTWEVWTSIAL